MLRDLTAHASRLERRVAKESKLLQKKANGKVKRAKDPNKAPSGFSKPGPVSKELMTQTYNNNINSGNVYNDISGKTILRYIESAKANNYRIYIVFMSLRSSELSMNRVSQRALLGKHYISMKQIMNRYDRSLNNFFNIYKDLADFWVAADNSTLNIEILYWGGNAFARSEKIYSQSMGKNYLTQHIDSKRISLDDNISPAFYKLVKARVAEEIRNRPKGNYVSVQNEDGKIEFVKPV